MIKFEISVYLYSICRHYFDNANTKKNNMYTNILIIYKPFVYMFYWYFVEALTTEEKNVFILLYLIVKLKKA